MAGMHSIDISRSLLVLMPLLGSGAGLIAADRYVAPSGRAGAAGTIDDPHLTIGQATGVVQPGDTIWLRAGTYREQITFPRSGTAAQPITVRAYQAPGAVRPETAIITTLNPVVPGSGGAGTWVDNGGGLWSIDLPASGLLRTVWSVERGDADASGMVLARLDGVTQREARWPDQRRDVDPDRDGMAMASESTISTTGFTQTKYDRSGTWFTVTYRNSGLAGFTLDQVQNAFIDLNPGAAWGYNGGYLTGLSGDTMTFVYRSDSGGTGYDRPQAGDQFALSNRKVFCDSPGEVYVDLLGRDGPANRLYLRTEPGASPVGRLLEVRQREDAATMWGVSHIHFADLQIIGGKIFGDSPGLWVDRCTFVNAAWTHNGMRYLPAAVQTQGDSSGTRVTDSTFLDTKGNAIGFVLQGEPATISERQIRNNVIREAFGTGIALYGSRRVIAEGNSVMGTGSNAIGIGTVGGKILRNHVWRGATRVIDIGQLGCWDTGDLQGLEVAYNVVHGHLSPHDGRLGYNGGAGIRFDGGGSASGCSNFIVHHNLLWSFPGFDDIQVWGLTPSQVGYGNVRALVANNTCQGRIRADFDRLDGIDIRNNLAAGVMIDYGTGSVTVASNLFTDDNRPGNLSADPTLRAFANGDGALAAGSPAIDAGTVIPGITNGHLGLAPDLGAREHGAASWVAGAVILARDLDLLVPALRRRPDGGLRLRLSGFPLGRGPGAAFAVRIDGGAALPVATEWDFRTDRAAAEATLASLPVVGTRTISVSLDGAAWTTLPAGLPVAAPAVSSSTVFSQTGGEAITLGGNGLWGHHTWLYPIAGRRCSIMEHEFEPLPLHLDGASLVAQGRMQADGRDARILSGSDLSPCRSWTDSTGLVWFGGPDGLNTPISDDAQAQLWFSVGDPARTAVGTLAQLRDGFKGLETERGAVQWWFSSTDLAGRTAPVDRWSDRSGAGHDVTASGSGMPSVVAGALAGLPALRFDGLDDSFLTPGALGTGRTTWCFVYQNPDPGSTRFQRLMSIDDPDPGQVDWQDTGIYVEPRSDSNWNVYPNTTPQIMYSRHWEDHTRGPGRIGGATGDQSTDLTGSCYKGDLAEAILTATASNDIDQASVLHYLRRKYRLSSYAELNTGAVIAPVAVTIDGRSAEVRSVSASGITIINPGFTAGRASLPIRVTLPGGTQLTTTGAVPALPLTGQDIGSVGASGSTAGSGGTWTVVGSGADIWNSADAFHFAARQVSGDLRIIARVDSLSNTNSLAKAGVMIRESLAAGSRQVLISATPGAGIQVRRRTATDGVSYRLNGPVWSMPTWVRLDRIGTTISTYASPDGVAWTLVASYSLVLPAQVQIGLAVTSHKYGTRATGRFSNVTITAP